MLLNLSPIHSDFDIKADPVSVVFFFFLINHLKLPVLLRTLGVSVGMGNPFKISILFLKVRAFKLSIPFMHQ